MIYSDKDVGNLRDLGLALDVVGKHFARLRAKREKLLNARIRPTERPVADHAIIRYLERVEGVDLDAVRNRVRVFVETCDKTAVRGVLRHPETGVQAILNQSGLIVTILPADTQLGYESTDWETVHASQAPPSEDPPCRLPDVQAMEGQRDQPTGG